MEQPKLPSKRVVVIGAGIAGLTAAQELAERGFEVEVVEAEGDQYDQTQPRLGGLARTSWARVPQPLEDAPVLVEGTVAQGRQNGSGSWESKQLKKDDVLLPVTLTFKNGVSPDGDEEGARKIVASCVGHPDRAVSLIAIKSLANSKAQTILDSLGPAQNASPEDPAETMKTWIKENVANAGIPYALSVLTSKVGQLGYLQVGVLSDRVPGEHGFRFFPSFYRHMFDTAQRIPIPEVSLDSPIVYGSVPQADSSRTVFDNITSGTSVEMAFAPNPRARTGQDRRRGFSVPRTPVTSSEVMRRMQKNALEKAGYRGLDVVRLMTKYLEYMTTSPERRRQEYEKLSWADFMGLSGDKYSPYFASQVNGGAQMLVAMSTKTNDARTIGTPATQLILDALRAGPRTDGILNGPTTPALFSPWQNYLQTLGVQFTRAKLLGLQAKGMAVRPFFEPNVGAADVAPADYYVIAIPVLDFQDLIRKPAAGCAREQDLRDANSKCLSLELQDLPEGVSETEDPNDFEKYLNFPRNDFESQPDGGEEGGPFRYMCGIQFFFAADVSLIGGHSMCPDSPWGVCFLSQVQYWQDRQRGSNGVRGVVSATFTQFQVKANGSDGVPKTALECTPPEMADRVWEQIKESWDPKAHGPLPKPQYFYLDENLKWEKGKWTNDTPYLVNDIETWPRRGGVRTNDDDYRYVLQFGHTVFAGVFMRTWTRMNTMEAANETGRRAVNAILAKENADAPPCQLWNMENYEVPELLALRDLDRRVFERGGKHPMESTALEIFLRATPWDLMRLGLPTYPDPTDPD